MLRDHLEVNPGVVHLEANKLEIVLDRLEYMARQKDAFSLIKLGQDPSLKTPTTPLVQESQVYGRYNDVEAIIGVLLEVPESGSGELM